MTKTYLYAVRDAETGKLVSDLTNPRRKYWDREANRDNAIYNYRRRWPNSSLRLEPVAFELVEVVDK